MGGRGDWSGGDGGRGCTTTLAGGGDGVGSDGGDGGHGCTPMGGGRREVLTGCSKHFDALLQSLVSSKFVSVLDHSGANRASCGLRFADWFAGAVVTMIFRNKTEFFTIVSVRGEFGRA